MTSEVNICNQALTDIGTRSTIASLTEDSQEAQACSLVYSTVRDQVLGMAFWNFARKTATLSELKSAPGTPTNPTASGNVWSSDWPAPPWLYEYAYPSDCIQMRFICPQFNTGVDGVPIFGPSVMTSLPAFIGTAVRFAVATDEVGSPAAQTNVILTNQYQAIGVYTVRITNTNLFSSQFVTALSAALAAKLAMSLAGDRQLAKGLYELANSTVLQARASDGIEGLTIQDTTPDWILSRGGFGSPDYGSYFMAPYNPLFVV